MTPNKVLLKPRIESHEELALKCMEFATEFMLKKAQYRLLNPLHFAHLRTEQINQQSQLMAELSSYSCPQPKPLPVNKSILYKSSAKLEQSPTQDIELPETPNKQSPGSEKQKQPSGLLELNELSRIESVKPKKHPGAVSKPPIKQTKSYLLPDLKEQSNINRQDIPQNYKLDLSQEKDAQSSTSSKRNKAKHDKATIHSQKIHIKQEPFPSMFLSFTPSQLQDFKKKPTRQAPLQKSPTQSPVTKKQQSSEQQSDDSFDNIPLPTSSHHQNETNDRASFASYHSSVMSDAKKMQINVVSQHASENDISVVSYKRRQEVVKGESAKVQKREQPEVAFKKSFSQKDQSPGRQQQTHSVLIPQRSSTSHLLPAQQPFQHNQITQDPVQNLIQPQLTPSPQQISSYLMRMESFEVQQQMLIKKLAKVWTRDSPTLKTLKNIHWQHLQLPKPSYNIQSHRYASVIQ